MHLHRLWDNENECKNQCYQIEDNDYFKRLDILSNLLHFILCNEYFQKILKRNESENISCKGFF